VELLRSGLAAGGLCDTLAERASKRVALVRHKFTRRIRERKGESEASLQEQMDHRPRLTCIQQMVLVLKFQSVCAPVATSE
jgi:hypothetical protein